MSNLNHISGAMPVERVHALEEYVAAGVIYAGDFVSQEAGGRVVAASATSALCGVAMSYASAAGQKVLVANHPDQKFEVQSDDASEPAAQTAIGLNFDIVVGSASTLYKRSAMALDGSTGATLATLPLRLLRIGREPDNAFGGYAKCVVVINNHQLKGGTGTIGV